MASLDSVVHMYGTSMPSTVCQEIRDYLLVTLAPLHVTATMLAAILSNQKDITNDVHSSLSKMEIWLMAIELDLASWHLLLASTPRSTQPHSTASKSDEPGVRGVCRLRQPTGGRRLHRRLRLIHDEHHNIRWSHAPNHKGYEPKPRYRRRFYDDGTR